jgi:hypothetical protein
MAIRQDDIRRPHSGYGRFGIIGRILAGRRFIYIVASLLILWWFMTLVSGMNTWKAVYLDDGNVYFGKFTTIPFSSTIKLRDSHYLKSAGTSTDLIVASKEDDRHQPKGDMAVYRNHILFTESLKRGSTLVDAIELMAEKSALEK